MSNPRGNDTADVVVIGMGPGGEIVAGKLAGAGLDVVGIDKELLGGECPYWGCVPSKMMIRAANLLAEGRRIPGTAGEAAVQPDWGPVARRLRETTDDWDDREAVERFERKGGRFLRGRGRLVGPATVAVGEREITARRAVVLASGTRPSRPAIDGLDAVPYWTNRDAIEVDDLPASLLVLGGGAIGAELAQVFARFGVDVTVVEATERLLSVEEPEAGETIAEVFAREGIDVRTSATASAAGHDREQFTLELDGGARLSAERLLVTTGREADLDALGLDAIGIDPSQRWVPVDDHLRVTDGVWAVGDVTGKGAFTHVATYQASILIADILGEDPAPADYRALPRVTFTDPEVGAAGLTEAQARDQGVEVRIGATLTSSTARGWIHGPDNDGLIKLIADADRGVLVGATAVGPTGGEVIGLLTLAIHARVPLDALRRMIYAYPTFHRGVEDALRDLDG